MQQALADGEKNPLTGELGGILRRPVEAMHNPRLLHAVFFSQGDDFVVTFHVVQNHRLFHVLRQNNLSLEKPDLLLKVSVKLVQTCLAKGNDLRLLQVLFQFVQGFINLKISPIQCPRMNAVTIIALLGTRSLQVEIDDLYQVVTEFYSMGMDVNKCRFHTVLKTIKDTM